MVMLSYRFIFHRFFSYINSFNGSFISLCERKQRTYRYWQQLIIKNQLQRNIFPVGLNSFVHFIYTDECVDVGERVCAHDGGCKRAERSGGRASRVCVWKGFATACEGCVSQRMCVQELRKCVYAGICGRAARLCLCAWVCVHMEWGGMRKCVCKSLNGSNLNRSGKYQSKNSNSLQLERDREWLVEGDKTETFE